MAGVTALLVILATHDLVAVKLDRWWITAPMIFVATGAILGASVLDILPLSLSNKTVLTVTELTLAFLLFSDASTIRLRDVESDASLPNRLLFIGLPLTAVVGAVVAHLLLPEVGWASAALIAVILAPTDAALGLAVVINSAVPVRIRRALNVESGLNDGIVTPFVTLFIAIVAAEEHISGREWGLGSAQPDRVGAGRGGRRRIRRRCSFGVREGWRMDL
jgi:sodium/hydrogen antiporter